MESEEKLSQATAEKLRAIRATLLHLHKTLLERERDAYEREHGKIGSSYEYLNLVMHDQSFAWLRLLSELIVQIDEALDGRERPSEAMANTLIQQSRLLLTPNESGPEFQRKYFTSVQESPEVVLAHAEFAKLLGPSRLAKDIH